MFEKITKKLIDNTKETVKKDITRVIKNNLPKIIGVVTIGITILSFMEDTDAKTMDEGKVVVINNYYGPSRHLHMI